MFRRRCSYGCWCCGQFKESEKRSECLDTKYFHSSCCRPTDLASWVWMSLCSGSIHNSVSYNALTQNLTTTITLHNFFIWNSMPFVYFQCTNFRPTELVTWYRIGVCKHPLSICLSQDCVFVLKCKAGKIPEHCLRNNTPLFRGTNYKCKEKCGATFCLNCALGKGNIQQCPKCKLPIKIEKARISDPEKVYDNQRNFSIIKECTKN